MAHKTRGTKTDYASDVTDEEWAFCAPYLTLMKEDAPQRDYTMRGLFNAVRYMGNNIFDRPCSRSIVWPPP